VARYQLLHRIADQVRLVREGFFDVVSEPVMANYTVADFEHFCGGFGGRAADLDPADWCAHAVRVRNNAGAQQAAAEDAAWQAFWAIVRDESTEFRTQLFQYATGDSRPPAGGFSELRPPFSVRFGSVGMGTFVPTASTCGNALTIPTIADRPALRAALLRALDEFAASGGAFQRC
jgi:ubiquitin-protein ligase E3 C